MLLLRRRRTLREAFGEAVRTISLLVSWMVGGMMIAAGAIDGPWWMIPVGVTLAVATTTAGIWWLDH